MSVKSEQERAITQEKGEAGKERKKDRRTKRLPWAAAVAVLQASFSR